jgi:TolB-like protein/Tfp pilus assembly protein PilF
MIQQDVIAEFTGNSELVIKQLDRICASRAFGRSNRLKRFLTFVVKETVEGNGNALKESTVGVEVFDRDPFFDPRSDPIVRVQARRLRALLEQYYAEEAGAEEIVVDVPKGAYIPVFKPPRSFVVMLSNRQRPSLLVNKNTVTVLPFEDLSPAGDLGHFCSGLSDEIIHSLVRLGSLVVCSTTLDNQKEWTADKIAQTNAAIGIRGSVRKCGSAIRITVNLVDVASGSFRWSMSLDRTLEETLSVQAEIALLIAEKLLADIGEGITRQTHKFDSKNTTACNYYLQGRYHLDQRTEEGLCKAVEFFEKAVLEDSEYAQAHAGLADSYALLGHYGVLSPSEVWTKAEASAAWAVLCNEKSAEAHTSLAHMRATRDWDWLEAEREFQTAMDLDCRYSTAHHWYGISLLAPIGRMEEAYQQMQLAHALDPISPAIARDVARLNYYLGDYDAALEQCDRTIELDPHFSSAYSQLGFVQESRGEFEESSAAFKRAVQLSPRSPNMRIALGRTLALAGKQSEALEILRDMLELASKRYVSPFQLALLQFATGYTDECFQLLEKAFEDHCFELSLLRVDPRLHSMKSDKRFSQLVAKLGLP